MTVTPLDGAKSFASGTHRPPRLKEQCACEIRSPAERKLPVTASTVETLTNEDTGGRLSRFTDLSLG